MPSQRGKPRVWWGSGLAPTVEWPGVTIEIPAVWVAASRRWESPDGRYYFDRSAADKAVDFFPTFLQHHIGAFAGQPFELLPYQVKLLTRPLFGWKRATDGLRRFRRLTLFAPKASGKSPWGSGTGLYLLLFDGEPAAEIYALASDREQARVVHRDGQVMIEGSPELAARCEVMRDSIYVSSTHSTFKVLSADSTGHHGWRPHGIIIDEIQLQRNRDQVEVARHSMSKRRQPLLLLLGHAGVDDESIGYEEFEYAKAVIAGTLTDEELLPVIFEAAETDDWQAEETWKKVNPGYGTTIQPEGLAAEAREAANEPRKLNDFLRFHLNRWTNQATAWLPIDWWTACETPGLEPASVAAHEAYAGLDAAQSIDYTALAVVVRLPLPSGTTPTTAPVTDETGVTTDRPLDYSIAVFPFYWLPEETMREREKTDGLPLSLYKSRGQLFTTPGATISADQVFRDITTRIAPQFPRLRTIGFDPAFAADISQRLSAAFSMVECPQNYNFMTAPCYTFEGLLKGRRVQHAGHPLLGWNISNVEVKRDEAGRLRPVKPKVVGSHRKRIDGVVALLMTLSMLGRQAPLEAPKEYQMMVFGGRR
jgi:phage terminase large subunit-like protein